MREGDKYERGRGAGERGAAVFYLGPRWARLRLLPLLLLFVLLLLLV